MRYHIPVALKHNYTLVCDEIRKEDNHKLLIIGLYVDGQLVVPRIPFQLPSLTFLQSVTVDAPGDYSFRAQIQVLESGKILAKAIGILQAKRAGTQVHALNFRNLQLEAMGAYNLAIQIDDQSEEPWIVGFSVVLRSQQQSRTD